MRPMLATPGPLPSGPEWTFECKWDGMRLLASVSDDVRLNTRNGNDATSRFGELVSLVRWLSGTPHESLVLDGELIAADDKGRPSFAGLSQRMVTRQQKTTLQIPITRLFFDTLALDGEKLTALPYTERRSLLEGLRLQSPSVVVAETYTDGAALFTATREQGLEGVIAKRNLSTYQAGVRSRDWIKVPHRTTHEYVVVGWRPARSGGGVGSLALATDRDRAWRFIGAAGSGLSHELSDALAPVLEGIAIAERLEGIPTDFRPVEPHLVVEVEHLGHGSNGLLRHPAIIRMRPDLTASDLSGTEESWPTGRVSR